MSVGTFVLAGLYFTGEFNHGPLRTDNQRFANETAKTRFLEKRNRGIVFAMDGEIGHVVRVKMTRVKPTVALTWASGAKKPTVLARDLPAIKQGE